jgi:hypothetical protein
MPRRIRSTSVGRLIVIYAIYPYEIKKFRNGVIKIFRTAGAHPKIIEIPPRRSVVGNGTKLINVRYIKNKA